MQLFNFGSNEVRVVEKNGEPWFCASDVCAILEIGNTSDAVRRLDEDEKGIVSIDTLGGAQSVVGITESGLYVLVLGSRKPEAKAFRKWITSEVIPSIRKYGSYSALMPKNFSESLRLLAEKVEENERITTEKLMLEQRVMEYEPKISYLDSILKSKDTVTITQIAKDYGLSGQALNKILHEEKVQYLMNDQWLLYKKHQDKGYTKSQTFDVHHTDGTKTVKMNTRWTQKGRLFIHESLEKRGIVPFMDREDKATEVQ